MNDETDQLRVESSVESHADARIAVVALEGELDLGVLGVLEAALGNGDNDRAGLVIDLTGLSFVDSAGIQALMAARAGMEESGTRSAVVVVPGSNVERIFDMTGLLGQLAPHPDRDSALAAVASARE